MTTWWLNRFHFCANVCFSLWELVKAVTVPGRCVLYLTFSLLTRVSWAVNILVWAEFARKTPHEVSLIQSAGIVLTTLLLMLKGNTQEKAKQRANMSEKSVKESVQTHSCLHLHACVLSHTLSLSLTHTHTHTHSNDSTSFDFKIKGQIHYRIIKSALEKKISILWD